MQNRRQLLKAITAFSMGGLSQAAVSGGASDSSLFARDLQLAGRHPHDVAKDEAFWARVSRYYQKGTACINLEQGYWGKMASPVESELLRLTRKVNKDMAWYARKHWQNDFNQVKNVVAEALGAKFNEVALTRNATESFVNLITQYKGLQRGDAILWADTDYPSFKNMMQ